MHSRGDAPYVHKDEIQPPSERKTGLTFAAVAAILALVWRDSGHLCLLAAMASAIFAGTALVVPAILGPLNRAWFKLGMLLNRVVSPIVMFVLFAAVIVPFGVVMRCFRDPLQSRRNSEETSSWCYRDAELDSRSSMKNQF